MAAPKIELGRHVGPMVIDGPEADTEEIGDLATGLELADETEDFSFKPP